MKLAVGLPVLAEVHDSGFLESVAEFRDEIGEVYFAWIGEPSGRSVSSGTGGRVDPTAQQCLESDLRALREMGLRLDLLCNANCYGPGAASTRLADHITSLVDHLLGAAGLDTVTTASPFIAAVIKRAFPELKTRASVNMRIGTVEGMRYLADIFDSFHLQREYNRDRERIAEVAQWCRRNGKTLCLLANSGCLYSCSGQTFHDNLVAHEGEWLGPQGRHPGFAQGLDGATDVPRAYWSASASWTRPRTGSPWCRRPGSGRRICTTTKPTSPSPSSPPGCTSVPDR